MDKQSDRELLEAAAKAAGLGLVWSKGLPLKSEQISGSGKRLVPWNPLVDDGDAMRLAMQLRMSLDFVLGADEVTGFGNNRIFRGCIDASSEDYAASARRAIVQVAASLGSSHG